MPLTPCVAILVLTLPLGVPADIVFRDTDIPVTSELVLLLALVASAPSATVVLPESLPSTGYV